jgi:hypothetical protein
MALDKKDVVTVLVAGAIGVMVAPVVFPVIQRLGRPAAKSAVKTAVLLYQRGRESAAEFVETMEDLVAEAHAELETEAAAVPAPVAVTEES